MGEHVTELKMYNISTSFLVFVIWFASPFET